MRRRNKTVEGESTKAIAEAQVHLAEVKQRAPEVTQVVRDMRILRERNHFAERLTMLMGGKHA